MQLRSQTPLTSSTEKQTTDDEFWPLSGKPYFSVVLTKSCVRPTYHLFIPRKMHPILPSLNLPVTLTCHGRSWNLNYSGTRRCQKFYSWRTFCNDNNLMVGDACVFELIECSSKKLRFGVQILKGDIPIELSSKIQGESIKNPILID